MCTLTSKILYHAGAHCVLSFKMIEIEFTVIRKKPER